MKRLGCAERYTATIERQPHSSSPMLRHMQIPQAHTITWERRLDEASEGTVVIPKRSIDPDCCRKLGQVQPWAHELSIYREKDLVWQGPIYDITESRTEVSIIARDVLIWLDNRFNHSAFDFTGPNIKDIGFASDFLIRDAIAAEGVGMISGDPHMSNYISFETIGVNTEISAASPGEINIGEQLRTFAESGMDITTIGRRILILKEKNPEEYTGLPLALSDSDFVDANIQVRRPGADMATRIAVLGDGVVAIFPTDPVGSSDYGLLEKIISNDSITTATDANALLSGTLRRQFPHRARFIVVPDDSRLTTTAPVTVNDLVCGTRIDVYAQSFCQEVAQPMKLIRASGSWNVDDTERIGISLGPLYGTT